MNEKIFEHKSELISKVLSEIPKELQIKTDRKMRIAAQLDLILKDLDLSKSVFASKMKKQPSEITRWLSGTHNFTIDTITEIECVLNRKLIKVENPAYEVVKHFRAEMPINNPKNRIYDNKSILLESKTSSITKEVKIEHESTRH